tara:strand:- start:715 stop:1044 length:330 start_codon:yes stop_codon:yes gene_type:complete
MTYDLISLPGEYADSDPDCSNCCDTGELILEDGFREECDCASGEVLSAQHREEREELDDDQRQAERDEQEYQAGVAQGERYSMERKIYGSALADEFAMQDELNAYNWGL